MENKVLQVILGDPKAEQRDVATADFYFLMSQSDYVRAKFRFDGQTMTPEDTSSTNTDLTIEFPNANLDTWNEAMHYLEPAGWVGREDSMIYMSSCTMKELVEFYKEYCFTQGTKACDRFILNRLESDSYTPWNDEKFAFAAIAIKNETPSLKTIRRLAKRHLSRQAKSNFMPWKDCIEASDLSVLLSSYDMDLDTENAFLRRVAACFLHNAYQNGESRRFGIREKSLKEGDMDEIAHYLAKEDVRMITTDMIFVECWISARPRKYMRKY